MPSSLMLSKPKPAGPAPSAATLRGAALRHLSRFAVTEAGLVRVLDRRVQRWARQAANEGQEIAPGIVDAQAAARHVARTLADFGIINDALFASARATRLVRSGRSRQAVAAHLAEKGVQPEIALSVLPDLEREISSALAYARRRRLGPFRIHGDLRPVPPDLDRRDLGALARAGFSREVSERALRTPTPTAQALVDALKQG